MTKSDWDFAWECWDLVKSVSSGHLFCLAVVFQMAKEGTAELDAKRIEEAQGMARLAIEDLQKLDKALEAKKESI